MAVGELSAVAVLILALLNEQPMHPYQVHQNLVERGDTRLVRVNAGAVYHGIERLEKEGLVEAAGTERSGNRPERTTYRITDAGRSAVVARLTSFLGDDHPSYPLFSVGLAEAHEVPARTVIDQLTRRRDRESERMALLGIAHERLTALGSRADICSTWSTRSRCWKHRPPGWTGRSRSFGPTASAGSSPSRRSSRKHATSSRHVRPSRHSRSVDRSSVQNVTTAPPHHHRTAPHRPKDTP